MAWSTELDADGNIRVQFEGYLDDDGGLASANEVAVLLDQQSRELILEVEGMRGYKRGARLAWQKVLWGRRHLISRMVLVGANPVVKMGGTVMAMFLGVPVLVIESDVPIVRDRAVSRPRKRRERSWGGVPVPPPRADSHTNVA